MKKYGLLFVILLLAALACPIPVVAQQTTRLEASVVIHFDSGKTLLSVGDKERLRNFFQKYETGHNSRVFVVGYTDAIGDKNHNYKLSRKRAQAIRRKIISAFGLNAEVVMAMGKGEENPVADNRKASGRASNRRAEIYLVNTKLRKPKRVYGPDDPYLSNIETLVQEAKTLTKQRRIGEALKILKKARGLGGDHYSDWHSTYGIVGFYANAPDTKVNAHLTKALQLDPYNYEAREYLGRVTARQKVAKRDVTAEMGLSVKNAISVTSEAQQHEYLRLFNVEPLVHRVLDGRPVDVWECVNAQGIRVDYFFDHSRVHDWAFASNPQKIRQQSALPGTIVSAAKGQDAPVSPSTEPSGKTMDKNPKKIWESKIFN